LQFLNNVIIIKIKVLLSFVSFYIIRKTTSEANENAGCGLGHAQRCMSLSYLPIVFIYINCSKCVLFNNTHLSIYYTEDHKLISSFEKGARTAYLSLGTQHTGRRQTKQKI
jgi:hypothetical protein